MIRKSLQYDGGTPTRSCLSVTIWLFLITSLQGKWLLSCRNLCSALPSDLHVHHLPLQPHNHHSSRAALIFHNHHTHHLLIRRRVHIHCILRSAILKTWGEVNSPNGRCLYYPTITQYSSSHHSLGVSLVHPTKVLPARVVRR